MKIGKLMSIYSECKLKRKPISKHFQEIIQYSRSHLTNKQKKQVFGKMAQSIEGYSLLFGEIILVDQFHQSVARNFCKFSLY